jgi:NADH-quinone oxidoreductase subunit J
MEIAIPVLPFVLLATLAIVFALAVIFSKNPVSSAFALVMVFFCFGGFYALMGAHLVAALQIIVYTGAIMVLFVFVIMLLNADAPSFEFKPTDRVFRGVVLAGAAVMVALFFVIFRSQESFPQKGQTEAVIEAAGGNTNVLSQQLFTEYLYPFELTSILLLAAIVGVVAIAKRKGNKAR